MQRLTWGWVMADGPVCGAGFLRSVLQGALLRGFLLRLGLIVTYNQIPLFVLPFRATLEKQPLPTNTSNRQLQPIATNCNYAEIHSAFDEATNGQGGSFIVKH